MVYALEYEPGALVGPPCTVTTCLQLNDSPGRPRDKISLLIIAGTHNWIDDDTNGRLKNDLDSVFDSDTVLADGNNYYNPRFYRHLGNDKILVIDEIGP